MKALFLYGCLLCVAASAQELPPDTEQQVENLADESPEDDALLQSLAFYRKHPLNLNTATAEELQGLRLLNELQIASLLRYRQSLGPFLDVYELQAVPGLDLVTVRRLRPFVVAGMASTAKETLLSRLQGGDGYALFRLSRTLEKAKGFDGSKTTHYLGDRNRLLLAYRYQHKTDLYYGFVADKDAGEPFLRRAQKGGFDFYSAHFFTRNLGRVKALALGDYVVNLGQGLTQWQSLAFGKSADALNIKRQSPVLLPYRSPGEFLFNRGAGITVGLGAFEATGFVSYKKFSGNLVTDSVPRFTSFNTAGYHRTAAEAADRYGLHDLSAGSNLRYKKGSLLLEANAVWHRFSRPLQKSAEPYNRFALSGREALNASLAYGFTRRNAHFFGQVAADKSGALAMLHGLLLSVDRRVDLSFLYRRLSPGYQSLFGNAFSENTLPTNEEGLYTGLVLRPAAGWALAAYADIYSFPFLKYRVSAPSRGWDYLAQVTWSPSRQSETYLRFRNENKPLNASGNATIRYPETYLRKNLRLHLAHQITPSVLFRSRLEAVWLKNASAREEGFLSYAEAVLRLPLNGSLVTRLQFFETTGYDSRIYAYESDVLYAFSIPASFDKGFRYYITCSFKLLKPLTVWLRFAQTIYRNKSSVGSGLDEIEGPRRSDLRVQIRYAFSP